MAKDFIYFPSLSNGGTKDWLTKNIELHSGITTRFYSDNMPEAWRYKYFLLSAGHNYKNKELRKDMGLEDTLCMGDSGGYQIISGILKWKDGLLHELFEWLETNSDVAMNLDFPPRGKLEGRYDESMDISFKNFKHFEKHQTGKTDFLNVLHSPGMGADSLVEKWYNKMNGFEFNGWALGGAKNIRKMMFFTTFLLDKGEFDKKQNRWVHYLGVSSLRDFMTLAMIQNAVNKRVSHDLRITTDSSSPSRAALFGSYFFNPDWKRATWQTIHLPRDHEYNMEEFLPCTIDCPACSGKTYKELTTEKNIYNKSNIQPYKILTTHNLYQFIKVFHEVNQIVKSDDYVINEIFGNDMYALYQSINKIFEADKPFDVYNKHTRLYEKLSSTEDSIIKKENIGNWFDFKGVDE